MAQADKVGEYRLMELVGEGSFGKVGAGASALPHTHKLAGTNWRAPPRAVAAPAGAAAPPRASHAPLLFPRARSAQVWKARRSGSLQTVAVKLITKRGKNEKDVRSLRQEIDILRELRHPNIIEMLDAFETKNEFCVVTEFAPGGSTTAAACVAGRVGGGRTHAVRPLHDMRALRQRPCCSPPVSRLLLCWARRRAVSDPGGRPVAARGGGAQRGAPAGGRPALPPLQPHHPPGHEAAEHTHHRRRHGCV